MGTFELCQPRSALLLLPKCLSLCPTQGKPGSVGWSGVALTVLCDRYNALPLLGAAWVLLLVLTTLQLRGHLA